MEALLSTLFEAVSALNTRANELEDSLKLITDEVIQNSDKESSDYKLIQDQLDAIYITLDKLSNIEIKADAVDYAAINKFILDSINAIELPQPTNGIDGKDGVGIDGKDGKDGKDGISPTVDYELIKSFVDELPKPKDGIDGKSIKGDDGVDGVGIKDITIKNYTLTITLTDGTKKVLQLPRLVIGGGGTIIQQGGGDADLQFIELDRLFKNAYSSNYKELTYSLGNITQIDVWVNSAKSTKLFTKILSYTMGNISQIVITDETSGKIMTKNIGYNIDNNIESVTTQIS